MLVYFASFILSLLNGMEFLKSVWDNQIHDSRNARKYVFFVHLIGCIIKF